MSNRDFGYVTGFINVNGAICVAGTSLVLDQDNQPNAFVGIYKDKHWQVWEEGFTIISAADGGAKAPRAAVMLGRFGNVLSISEDGSISDARIRGDNELPNQYSGLSQVKRIGNSFYAVGMRRQVYMRSITTDKWRRIDHDVVVPLASLEVSGFLSLDGFDDSEIYFGGYTGRMWLYEAKTWRELASPTNSIIETISCMPGDDVFVGADDGVVLRGRGDRWVNLTQEVTTDHIVGSAVFHGRVYFSTETGIILSFSQGMFKDETPPPEAEWNGTTGWICTNDNRLLSIGRKDIMVFDGNEWRRIEDPPFEV